MVASSVFRVEVPVFIFIVFIVFRQRPNVQYGFSAQLQPLCGQGLDSCFTALTHQVKGSRECGLSLCCTCVGASPPCVRLQPQLKTSQPSTHYENLHSTKLCLIFQEYSFFFLKSWLLSIIARDLGFLLAHSQDSLCFLLSFTNFFIQCILIMFFPLL